MEVDEPESDSGEVKAGIEPDVPEKARLTFQDALNNVTPAAEGITRSNELDAQPDLLPLLCGCAV